MVDFIRKTYIRYRDNNQGQFGLWLAAIAFPLLVATSAVVDFRKAESNRVSIKGALDTAAIATASNNQKTKAEKIQFAKDTFWNNYVGTADITLDVKISDQVVEIDATGQVATSIGQAVGLTHIDVSEESAAEMDRINTICVLSLAPEGGHRISFADNMAFSSNTCAVHANSIDPEAIVSTSTVIPSAKAFCSAGGATGQFSPSVRGECTSLDDPYADVQGPVPGRCVNKSLFSKSPVLTAVDPTLVSANAIRKRLKGKSVKERNRIKARYKQKWLKIKESDNYTGNNKILMPGTYCGGLTVDGSNITFMPGNYIIKDGPLTFKNSAVVNANRVSFVLHGKESIVTVETGAQVTLKAPQSGAMAGLAIYQDADASGDLKDLPNGVSLISSGGNLNVIGTMYFPTQALDVGGDSVLGAQAPATSFIAYELAFGGDTSANVDVDHIEAGLPPLLPMSDDGARLIR